jgi:hypothetical protein
MSAMYKFSKSPGERARLIPIRITPKVGAALAARANELVLEFRTSWLSEPTTGVTHSEAGHFCSSGLVRPGSAHQDSADCAMWEAAKPSHRPSHLRSGAVGQIAWVRKMLAPNNPRNAPAFCFFKNFFKV